MKMITKLFAVAALAMSAATPALAYDWGPITVDIAYVNATYVPSNVPFVIAQTVGTCAAGTTLNYSNPSADNVKFVAAGLLAFRIGLTKIRIFGNNAGCVVTGILFG